MSKIARATVDLGQFPDLVVIYLGMKAHSLKGLGVLIRQGPRIQAAVAAKPEGLLLHENFIFSLLPVHLGMRQYWRDIDALETWSRSLPHQGWWADFLSAEKGVSFWHETYQRNGGVEAVYLNQVGPLGLSAFAPVKPAEGPMFSARARLRAGVGGAP